MARILVIFIVIIFCSLVFTAEGCSNTSDCDKDQHCCWSHCTSVKIRCSQLCNHDVDCSRDHLCSQQICVACSKRYNCEIKSCLNDTNCPPKFYCSKNHMCTKEEPKKQSFSLLPFIIIVAVFGFALIVLCYTEGCWKEFFLYIKRHTGRYGTIALDEREADWRDGENESGLHLHNNKSSSVNTRQENTTNTSPSLPRNTPTNSPQMLRNSQVISHNSRTLVMAISRAIENRSSPSVAPTGSGTRAQNTNGTEPLLSSGQAETNNSSESLPTYMSLFNQEFEEPPPKYEDVVNFPPGPISIEMTTLSHGTTSREREIETVV